MKKALVAALAAAVFTIVVAGCGPKEDAGTTTPTDTKAATPAPAPGGAETKTTG